MFIGNADFYYGISGLSLPVPKKHFPPDFRDKSRLEYYASLFNSIEVNSSFYKNPKAATVAKWASMVPDHFRFTFKLSKAVTHNKHLDFNEDDVEKFMGIISHVQEKKACLLIQFPPSNNVECLARLQNLLATIQYFNQAEWKLAVEFRNISWYEREVYEILDEYNATVVLHDIPASRPPSSYSPRDFAYIRFHGPSGNYRGTYGSEFIQDMARRIDEWRKENKMIHCYFNNTMGEAVPNLQHLVATVRG